MSKESAKINSVYFVGSVSSKEKYGDRYKQIEQVFKDLNYEVYAPVNDANLKEIHTNSREEHVKFYKEVQKKIKESDVFVAEISVSSSSIGYEIGFAVAINKPVLLLRSDEKGTPPGSPLLGNPSKLVTLLEYNSSNLEKKIKSFIRKAEKGIFVKRLPIEFTHNQVEYIEFRQGRGVERQSFNSAVREIVDQARDDDAKFKKFLAEF